MIRQEWEEHVTNLDETKHWNRKRETLHEVKVDPLKDQVVQEEHIHYV